MKFFDYLYITTIVLLILKLLNLTTISWFVVFSPMIIPCSVAVALLIILFLIFLLKDTDQVK